MIEINLIYDYLTPQGYLPNGLNPHFIQTLIENDFRFDHITLEQYEKNPSKVIGVIPALIKQKYPKYKTLGRSDTYKVKGFELSQHGDLGISGSRGSIQQFRKLNTKIVVGHSHRPER